MLPNRRYAVYPRACGGTAVAELLTLRPKGLSPRVRGNHGRRTRCGSGSGSIPARAGEPSAAAVAIAIAWVYPRACGGTDGPPPESHAENGLSPRVRGNRLEGHAGDPYQRSIPARAGEPSRRAGSGRSTAVYPRACGGTRMMCRQIPRSNGLSPRVRGNPPAVPSTRLLARSIPARAGEPSITSEVISAMRVYPRACGGTP